MNGFRVAVIGVTSVYLRGIDNRDHRHRSRTPSTDDVHERRTPRRPITPVAHDLVTASRHSRHPHRVIRRALEAARANRSASHARQPGRVPTRERETRRMTAADATQRRSRERVNDGAHPHIGAGSTVAFSVIAWSVRLMRGRRLRELRGDRGPRARTARRRGALRDRGRSGRRQRSRAP